MKVTPLSPVTSPKNSKQYLWAVDQQSRYMRPSRYDRHCRESRPLRFENQAFAGESVLHDEPKSACGFLIERYSGPALTQALDRAAKADKSDKLFEQFCASRLTMEVVEQVQRRFEDIERSMTQPFSTGNAGQRPFGHYTTAHGAPAHGIQK